MGGGHSLNLFGSSYARIESTPPLGTYYGGGAWAGGIWDVSAGGSGGRLEVLGGEIDRLDVSGYARAWLYGGRINVLETGQLTPQVDVFCKSYLFSPGTGMLTGIWGDDSSFSIHLVNLPGYTPTIDNINFHLIPEPVTLGLLALGSLLTRRYTRA
jgi:hypothetical protein